MGKVVVIVEHFNGDVIDSQFTFGVVAELCLKEMAIDAIWEVDVN